MRILSVCGSLRDGSTNSALLRTVTAVAPAEVEIDEFDGLAALPHFNPDDDAEPLHPAVANLRARPGRRGRPRARRGHPRTHPGSCDHAGRAQLSRPG